MNPLVAVLALLFFQGALSQSSYFLQVGHFAPGYEGPVNFTINAEQYSYFANIQYGSGTQWLDISEFLGYPTSDPFVTVAVSIPTVSDPLPTVLASVSMSLTGEYQTCFFINGYGSANFTTVVSSTKDVPNWEPYFNMINLSPVQEEITWVINSDEVSTEDDYAEYTDTYTTNPAVMSFSAQSQGLEVAASSYSFLPGISTTVVLTGIQDISLFELINYQSVEPCLVRALQTVPGKIVYVWVNDVFFGAVAYSDLTDYYQFPSWDGYNETQIYVSTDDTKPPVPQASLICYSSRQYTLALDGDLNNNVPLGLGKVDDQNFATTTDTANLRVGLFSPDLSLNLTVLIDSDVVGHLTFEGLTFYQSLSELTVNLTLVNGGDVVYREEFDLEVGSVSTLYVIGLENNDDTPLEGVLAVESTISPITKVSDSSDHDGDDDDDDDGLSAGAIVGIVVGVLFGVILFVGLFLYVRRRQASADYQAIPSNTNFL